MKTLILTFGAIGGAALLFCVYLAIRNQWVFRQRMAFNRECFDRDASQWFALGKPEPDDIAETYGAMMWRFWVWDKERFRKRRLPPPITKGQST